VEAAELVLCLWTAILGSDEMNCGAVAEGKCGLREQPGVFVSPADAVLEAISEQNQAAFSSQ
jgi:hypothetical protein